jgi:phage terminase large subunit-like protein
VRLTREEWAQVKAYIENKSEESKHVLSGTDLAMLVDEMSRYRAALEQIKFEMEKSGLSLVQHSVVYQTACKALEGH